MIFFTRHLNRLSTTSYLEPHSEEAAESSSHGKPDHTPPLPVALDLSENFRQGELPIRSKRSPETGSTLPSPVSSIISNWSDLVPRSPRSRVQPCETWQNSSCNEFDMKGDDMDINGL